MGSSSSVPANIIFFSGGSTFFWTLRTRKKTDRRATNKSQNLDKMKIGSPHCNKFPISVC